MDPVDVEDERIITMKTGIEKILHSIDDGLSIHDLRIVPCKDYDNIIFDMIVPPKYHNKDVIIKEQVCKEIEEKYPSYKAVIKIDKAYV